MYSHNRLKERLPFITKLYGSRIRSGYRSLYLGNFNAGSLWVIRGTSQRYRKLFAISGAELWVFETSIHNHWSPSPFPVSRLVKAAMPGNIFGIYFPVLKKVARRKFVV